jgi:predicted DNA-binding protein (MmcQ/YjbR family)
MPAKGRVMTIDEYNAFCGSLPHTTHVVQWGGAHVWKVAGKVFAIGGWNDAAEKSKEKSNSLAVSFKVSELIFEVLKDQPGVRPAPYLASRGMTWLQRTGPQTIKDKDFKGHLSESYRLVSLGLPKKVQAELGLNLDSKTLGEKPFKAPSSKPNTRASERKGTQ